jgi:hypothetical protein
MNFLIPLAFVIILGALAAAGYFMLRAPGADEDSSEAAAGARKKRMARALALRIGVSVVVFICVLIAWYSGMIQPTGIAPGR